MMRFYALIMIMVLLDVAPATAAPSFSGRPENWQVLPPSSTVEVTAYKGRQVNDIFINYDLAKEKGLPASNVAETIIAEYSYLIVDPSQVDGHYFLNRRKTFYVDFYGGSGVGRNWDDMNFGSGRAGSAGDFQVKGILKTPMATAVDTFHSNGLLDLSEALSEALWGEVLNKILPYGANRTLAVLEIATKFGPRYVMVRENPLRPAHFMWPLFTDSHGTVFHPHKQSMPESEPMAQLLIKRMKDLTPEHLLKSLQQSMPEEKIRDIASGLKIFVQRFGRQYGALQAYGFTQRGLTLSNIELGGALLDMGYMGAEDVPQAARFKSREMLIMLKWGLYDLQETFSLESEDLSGLEELLVQEIHRQRILTLLQQWGLSAAGAEALYTDRKLKGFFENLDQLIEKDFQPLREDYRISDFFLDIIKSEGQTQKIAAVIKKNLKNPQTVLRDDFIKNWQLFLQRSTQLDPTGRIHASPAEKSRDLIRIMHQFANGYAEELAQKKYRMMKSESNQLIDKVRSLLDSGQGSSCRRLLKMKSL